MFLPYMSMVAIFVQHCRTTEQIVNTLSTEGPMRNLVKIGQVVSEKMFNDYKILYMYMKFLPSMLSINQV